MEIKEKKRRDGLLSDIKEIYWGYLGEASLIEGSFR